MLINFIRSFKWIYTYHAGPIGVLHPSEMAIDARRSILTETLITVDRNMWTLKLILLSLM